MKAEDFSNESRESVVGDGGAGIAPEEAGWGGILGISFVFGERGWGDRFSGHPGILGLMGGTVLRVPGDLRVD